MQFQAKNFRRLPFVNKITGIFFHLSLAISPKKEDHILEIPLFQHAHK